MLSWLLMLLMLEVFVLVIPGFLSQFWFKLCFKSFIVFELSFGDRIPFGPVGLGLVFRDCLRASPSCILCSGFHVVTWNIEGGMWFL